jgi:hypothetical protein
LIARLGRSRFRAELLELRARRSDLLDVVVVHPVDAPVASRAKRDHHRDLERAGGPAAGPAGHEQRGAIAEQEVIEAQRHVRPQLGERANRGRIALRRANDAPSEQAVILGDEVPRRRGG